MDNILTIILKDTYTLSGLKHRIRILRAYLENALFGGGQKTDFSPQDFAFISSLGQVDLGQFTKDDLYQKFQNFEAEISKLPILTIYLPFESTDASSLQIGSYIRKSFNRIMLLDPKFDPNLIAGCSLVWNGVYRDYSLRAKIEQRKEEILESFRGYLR